MQRTTADRTLDHDNRPGQGDLQTITGGEVPRHHPGAWRGFTDQQPSLGHRALQEGVMPWINASERRAEHGHRRATGLQAAPMHGGIDPLGQTAHHRPAGPGQHLAQTPGHGTTMQGGPTRADDGHSLPTRQLGPKAPLTLPVQGQRWTLQRSEGRRPGRIPGKQQRCLIAQALLDGGQGRLAQALSVSLHLNQHGR